MKKNISYFLILIIFVCLVGCANNQDKKTIVTIFNQNSFINFEELVEKTYPDIDFQYEKLSYPSEIIRRLDNNVGPDLIIMSQPNKSDALKYFYDLSTTNLADNYNATVIDQYNFDGLLYLLPLPGHYSGYIINTTLLEEAGIEIPTTNQELVETLLTLKEKGLGVDESGANFAIQAEYNSTLGMYYAGCLIPDYLGKVDGEQWLLDFYNQKVEFSDEWNELTKMTDELATLGLFDSDIIARKKASLHYIDMMSSGELAIMYADSTVYQKIVDMTTEKEKNRIHQGYEFDMLPFLSNGENHPWTMLMPDGFIGINKDVDDETLDACLRILALISTNEGQKAIIEDISGGISFVKNYPNNQFIQTGLEKCIEEGYVYNMHFPSNVIDYIGIAIRNYYNSSEDNRDVAQLLKMVTDFYYDRIENNEDDLNALGIINRDMILSNYNVRYKETEIGNLVADSVREVSHAEIAVVNGGGIRASLYQGEIYRSDLSAVCPFQNKIVVLNMDGATLWTMMEHSLSEYSTPDQTPILNGRFLQVSGMIYTFDGSKEQGNRLISIKLTNGEEIDLNKYYNVAVNNYMAGISGYANNNGDGYTMLNVFDSNTPINPKITIVNETNLTYYDALVLFFSRNNNAIISSQLEGRIINANENE